MLENNWKVGDRPDLGAMNSANALIRELDVGDPHALPDLRRGSTIAIGSDYSGQHSTSKYEAFGLVFADLHRCGAWIDARRSLREELLSDGRRFSYKSLKDRQRAAALPRFLEAVDSIPGLAVVILVEKTIESLFKSSGRIESSDPEIRLFSHWSPRVVERLLRVCHFVAFFLAGLSREDQDVLWITDQDGIVANPTMHSEMVEAFGRISSHYLTHTLRHLRIATTASDTGKRDVEDFVSIADFAAGTVCETINSYHRADTRPVPGIVLPTPTDTKTKALHLMNWFSDKRSVLKRLVIAFESEAGSTRLRVRHYKFHGSTDDLA
jgi:hypothetical protein